MPRVSAPAPIAPLLRAASLLATADPISEIWRPADFRDRSELGPSRTQSFSYLCSGLLDQPAPPLRVPAASTKVSPVLLFGPLGQLGSPIASGRMAFRAVMSPLALPRGMPKVL